MRHFVTYLTLLIVLTVTKLGNASTLPEDTPENVGFPYWRNLSRHTNNA